ncbi:hypothetical protein HDU67_001098 [Dinochytrium kinnereticum]|nr:hypothetical protein HDU67_001098 [Dinochytrium kinnereticum]
MSPLLGRRRRQRKNDDLSEDDSDLERSFDGSDSESEIISEEDEAEEDDDESALSEDDDNEETVPVTKEGEEASVEDANDAVSETAAQLEGVSLDGASEKGGRKKRQRRPKKGRDLGSATSDGVDEGAPRAGGRDDDGFLSRGPTHTPKADAFWLHDDRSRRGGRGGFRGRGRGGAGYGRRGTGERSLYEAATRSEAGKSDAGRSTESESEVLDFSDLQKPKGEWGLSQNESGEKSEVPGDEWGNSPYPDPASSGGKVSPSFSEGVRRGTGRPAGVTRAAGQGRRGYGRIAPSATGLVDVPIRGSPRQGDKEVSSADQKWAHDKFQATAAEPPELSRRRSWGGQREPSRRRAEGEAAQSKRSSVSSFRQLNTEPDKRVYSPSASNPSRSSSSRRERNQKANSIKTEGGTPEPRENPPSSQSVASDDKSVPTEGSGSPVMVAKQPAPRRLALGEGGPSGFVPLWKRAAGEAAAEAQVAAENAKQLASLRAARKAIVAQQSSENSEPAVEAPAKVKRYLGSKAVEETLLNEPSEEVLKQAVNAPEFIPKSVLAEHVGQSSESSMTIVQEEASIIDEGVRPYRKDNRKERSYGGSQYRDPNANGEWGQQRAPRYSNERGGHRGSKRFSNPSMGYDGNRWAPPPEMAVNEWGVPIESAYNNGEPMGNSQSEWKGSTQQFDNGRPEETTQPQTVHIAALDADSVSLDDQAKQLPYGARKTPQNWRARSVEPTLTDNEEKLQASVSTAKEYQPLGEMVGGLSGGSEVSAFAPEFIPDQSRQGPRPYRGRGRGGFNSYSNRGDRSLNQNHGDWAGGSQRGRKFYQDPNAEINALPPHGYEDYQYLPNPEENGAIPVHPVMTSSGHVVLMTESGLMVPTDNFMYGGYSPYQGLPMYMPPQYSPEMTAASQQYYNSSPAYLPSAPLPVVYPLPADPAYGSEILQPLQSQMIMTPIVPQPRGIEIKDPNTSKKVGSPEREIATPSFAEAS